MMGVYWLLIILLSCTSPSRCSEQQWDVQCTTTKSPKYVFVPCPNMTAGHAKAKDKDTEVTYKLFKNQKMIQVYPNTQKPHNRTDLDIYPEKDKNGTLTGFRLTRKANTKQAIYMCEGTVTYPPPVISSNSTVLILEEGQGCPRKTEECKTNKPEEQKAGTPVWIWIVVVALLSTYSLAATITALIIWYKMKDADSQSDYINTKPRPPAKRRKKRGLQHPIPKHF
ncbi:uncharacterized protein LOC114137772 [Xiphophorus couchianus]|uniref:uncharacterized protein LOC114137772 n=1 Tax=Xiphophorus couchianus TaxID=32473 RepID=UPI001016698C|nr:uncharacterized protein LOC114137772 [Xiphophorus couchianus]